MVAAGGGSGEDRGSSGTSPHQMAGLRRCVICTGLSIFKRSKIGAMNGRIEKPTASGALESPPLPFDLPPRSFTCFGFERLAYVQALPPDDARLHQPDVALMWCLGKSVFLLQSQGPGFTELHEKVGRSWDVSSSSEVPISYRGISQSLTADEFARMPAQSASSSTASQRRSSPEHASPSLPQLVADLKPYFKESGSMLYDGIFTVQAHQHAASVLSQSLLSWSAHASALRMLQAGHDKACGIMLKTLRKWFGSGGA